MLTFEIGVYNAEDVVKAKELGAPLNTCKQIAFFGRFGGVKEDDLLTILLGFNGEVYYWIWCRDTCDDISITNNDVYTDLQDYLKRCRKNYRKMYL